MNFYDKVIDLGPVVEKVDDAIIFIQWMAQWVSLILICWITIVLVDSAIQG